MTGAVGGRSWAVRTGTEEGWGCLDGARSSGPGFVIGREAGWRGLSFHRRCRSRGSRGLSSTGRALPVRPRKPASEPSLHSPRVSTAARQRIALSHHAARRPCTGSQSLRNPTARDNIASTPPPSDNPSTVNENAGARQGPRHSRVVSEPKGRRAARTSILRKEARVARVRARASRERKHSTRPSSGARHPPCRAPLANPGCVREVAQRYPARARTRRPPTR